MRAKKQDCGPAKIVRIVKRNGDLGIEIGIVGTAHSGRLLYRAVPRGSCRTRADDILAVKVK